jgi:hypothetical protein
MYSLISGVAPEVIDVENRGARGIHSESIQHEDENNQHLL